jgi:putative oxidoreductase
MSQSIATSMPQQRGVSPIAVLQGAVRLTERIPLSLVQLMSRVAVAHVFWASAKTKLASWPVTLQLFAFEYRVPLLPPEMAAYLGTAAELSGAVLVLLGLATRFAALMLIGVVATIQIFVYPGHWAEHLMWASLLMLLVARGAGVVSLDYLIARYLGSRD